MKTNLLISWLLFSLGSSYIPEKALPHVDVPGMDVPGMDVLSTNVFGVDAPQVELSNGIIQTTLYLPDASRGYYQGTRFDWAGAFKSLTYSGHSFIDQWFEQYNPKTHDAINGPVEEFMPIGFTNAKPGETFVKVGVGVLRKPDDKPYFFGTTYDIVEPGTWQVKPLKDRIDFTHELVDATGYGYQYTKTIRLIKGKPELALEHTLKNTGKKSLETSVYDHNFFIIDKQPTGPQITVRFPFTVTGTGQGFSSVINAQGNNLLYSRDLQKNEQVFSAGLQGFGPTEASYDFRIENLKTGAGLHATADKPLEKLVYWACATTSCPEPYIRLQVAPGQEIHWTITYEFYQR